MIEVLQLQYLTDVYKNAQTVWNNGKYTTVNEFCDQVPALRPEVLQEAVNWLTETGAFIGNKIVTEEDKGAVISGPVALKTGKSLAVARWYPYKLPDSTGVKVHMESEYREGDLFLNGIKPGDRVTIIEDTISSGGTIIALVNAIRLSGAEVTEILAVVEKINFGGVQKVKAKTGLRVKTGIGITIDETGRVDVITNSAMEEVFV